MSRLTSIGLIALVLSGCAAVAVQSPTPPAGTAATAAVAGAAPKANTPPATSAAATPPAARPTGAAPAAGPSSPGTPPPPRPFADVIKDAKEIKGLFTLYEKEDKVWMEITPDQWGQLFFLQANLSRGVPDVTFLAGRRMLTSRVVKFNKQHNTIQLLARNFKHTATPGTPLARAVEAMSSDSLIAAVPVASQPHPDRKSILIEANAVFLNDIAYLSPAMEQYFRSGYALDARNSGFSQVRSTPSTTSLTVNAHYATARIPTPAPGAPANPAAAAAPVKSTPDARSFFIGLHYSLVRMPEVPMRPRLADARVGHFNSQVWNYSADDQPFARQYVVHRWRLEKKDPSAAQSEPKQPITYWIDKNVPTEYRDAVREGVLEWNKAFDKIGFKNAIVVKQQDDNDESNTDDTMRASVKWFVDYSDGALAVGPSTVDPRSGEILDADISVSAGWARLPRRHAGDQFWRPYKPTASVTAAHTHDAYCDHGAGLLDETAFAMDLLEMRGRLPHGSGEALDIARNVLKGLVMHEVGHTLGLRHNFRSSIIYKQAQLSDPAFTSKNGLSGSIMDYVPFNLALRSEPQGSYYGSTIGPYDYWAIEYAYREVPSDEETKSLAAIAGRSAEPELAYGTDEEVRGDGDGMDPEVNQRDMGDDPIAHARRRLALTKELWEGAQTQPLIAGESYAVQRRRFESGVAQMEAALGFVVKNVGGVVFLRDHVGTARAVTTPVAATRQRDALQLITQTVFQADGFGLNPAFASRLPIDHLDRGYDSPTDLSLTDRWLALQRSMLDRLLSERVAQRIVDAPAKLVNANDAFALEELYQSVETSVWRDATGERELTAARRSLQREHAKRIAAALTRPTPNAAAAEARSLHRQTAKRLVAQLDGAMKKAGVSATNRAHFDDMRDTLNAALQAVTQRSVS